jgi:hypothetical protein
MHRSVRAAVLLRNDRRENLCAVARQIEAEAAIFDLRLPQRRQPCFGHGRPISQEFPGELCPLKMFNWLELNCMLEGLPVEKLLSLSFAAIRFEQSHPENMLLGIGQISDESQTLRSSTAIPAKTS